MATKKPAQVRKPDLDGKLEKAKEFASAEATAPQKKTTEKVAAKPAEKLIIKTERKQFAPAGDRRLTINLREDLHRKVKQKALEEDTTAGEIIEALIDRYL